MQLNLFEVNSINFSPNGQLLACRGAKVKVFKVATGKVVDVCEVKGEMVCWNSSGNKLAVVTNGKVYNLTTTDWQQFGKLAELV